MERIQKASMLKRIAAYLLDLILLSIIIVGVASLLSLALNYDGTLTEMNGYYDKYAKEFGVDLSISNEKYNELTKEERQVYEDAFKAMNADESAVNCYNKLVNFSFVILVVSILVGYTLLEYIVPLIFKNGQTIGKKIFSLALVRDDCVRVSTLQMFARTILGKSTIETTVPAFIILSMIFGTPSLIGLVILPVILFTQLIMMATSVTNSAIHDRISRTVVVDMPSQMIFESTEHLMEYKKERHKEMAQDRPYF